MQFVDYKIDLNSLLPSHRSDRYQKKSGGKKLPRKGPQAAEFYFSILQTLSCGWFFLHFAQCSQMPVVFYRSVIHVLGFFNQEVLHQNVIMFLWNCREIILESYTLYWIQFARRLSQKQRRILACFNGVFTLMFSESISKIFNFSHTAEKKQLCKATTLPFLGRLPIARVSCLIVNKCKVHLLEMKKISGIHVAI